MLSVLPSLIDDESLISLILRTTIRNGFTSERDWMDAKCFDAITREKLSAKQRSALNELIHIPKPVINNKPDIIYSPLFTCNDSDLPRICPQCVIETGYLKQAWSAISNLYCERHRLALTDVCHHCGTKLQWSVALLSNTCPNEYCAKQLTSAPVKEEIAELFIDEICDCLLADLLLSNTFTTYLSHKARPHFKDLHATLIRGIALLTDKPRFQNFVQQLIGSESPFSRLPVKYQLFPLRLLTRHLKANWPIEQWVANALETAPYHQSPSVNIDEFIVTVEDAVKLLSIPKTLLISTIPELSDKKTIPSTLRVNVAHLIGGKISDKLKAFSSSDEIITDGEQ
ncbi:MAG: hypothetical protein ABJV04_01545 [Aliiglaciecola sp.]|uniref:hypothetical protein n=1 Tax=Aliiglaciecola sp. TaxID=1872441 RepID=UPI003299411E